MEEIQSISGAELEEIVELIPPAWIGNDGPLLARQFDRLIGRGIRLRDSISNALTYLRRENENNR